MVCSVINSISLSYEIVLCIYNEAKFGKVSYATDNSFPFGFPKQITVIRSGSKPTTFVCSEPKCIAIPNGQEYSVW